MTVASTPTPPPVDHLMLDDVSWDFYEHLLEEIANGHLRVTYDVGRMEIMSPLPRQERWGQWIARLIELICLECSIYVESLGSTTFRDPPKLKGLEPDKCFFVAHAQEVREIE